MVTSSADEEGCWKRLTETSPYCGAVSDESRKSGRQFAPSAHRNTSAIIGGLRHRLPVSGTLLEVASGTGQHIVAFAKAFPQLNWIPSDPHPAARVSISAYSAEACLPNLLPPLDIDVSADSWHRPVTERVVGIVVANLLHITPWLVTLGLLEGAAALLNEGAALFIYGCFKRNGQHLSPNNEEFDASLRRRDSRWGVRDVHKVALAAGQVGLAVEEFDDMPSNNLFLVMRKGKYPTGQPRSGSMT